MTLTKSDKAEIAQMIKDALASKPEQQGADIDSWAGRAIKSKLAGVLIAPEDFYIVDKDGEKKTHFTYDEAMEATKDLPDGWRLPTRHEWVLIAEEFGNDPETNNPSSQALLNALGLGLNGFLDNDDGSLYGSGYRGHYWSSTVLSSSYAYYLFIGSSEFGPSSSNLRYGGYSVRCVRDI